MNLKTAVGIYEKCLRPLSPGKCETCILNEKRWIEDSSVCALLIQAEIRARGLEENGEA